ncbi:pre-rRNA 2'-O-ribose RNA methyltransferase FTSJ3 isoform X2 [Xenopus tropicalis]|uniref:pre-rRNA processing protein FTSJ3 n=1 Tax=Xenopus tropicalis TaxID=8364 RepID=A0A8J0ST18_XENTR|nr:pre-rRNA 2'-O-ribose RNA methyltransferase FTSJ3 isoform X2 [Xenopus tropicalis]|eukprot:XP_012822456.1 PREDICTED: pre-rRNA processing protein FTSJ3 isoform X2 [Xenopus tropicalis]
MGKKAKVGKSRKDKFYHLAKETGYRSRSAFKLIQLNRKFQFLPKARALVDLCAAPGGWLQVAAKFMPISSLIIGVDLVPIKPIPKVLTLQEDITTEACRQTVRKHLQTWKADVVLNDGAPNVGANWTHDAFSQVHLSLMALRLACDCLSRGGWFITKIFRSSDYQSLLWILQQFFKKVNSTKPQASRSESAEIFVVCQGFLAPDKIDTRFFDPKFAFKDVDGPVQTVSQLLSHKKPKAEGYAATSLSLYHRASLVDFLTVENPVDFLSKTSEIILDDTEFERHPATTNDIRECCRDIKVLGRKELRLLLSWRSKLRRHLARKLKAASKETEKKTILSSDEGEGQEPIGEKDYDQEDEELHRKLAEVKAEELSTLKRKKKRLLKAQRQQRERIELKMDLPGVSIADEGETGMFSLHSIGKNELLQTLSQGDMCAADSLIPDADDDIVLSNDETGELEGVDEISLASDLEDYELQEIHACQKIARKKMLKNRIQSPANEFWMKDEGQVNPLLVPLEDTSDREQRDTGLWFGKGIFSSLDFGADEDLEIKQMQLLKGNEIGKIPLKMPDQIKIHSISGTAGANCRGLLVKSGTITSSTAKATEFMQRAGETSSIVCSTDISGENYASNTDSDTSEDESIIKTMKRSLGKREEQGEEDKSDFEVVPLECTVKRSRVLGPDGLALGTVIATSKKSTRDLIDSSFNRRNFNDDEDELPDWFVSEERKHRIVQVPVDRYMMEEYRKQQRELNARPIKKVAEAKARKKRRTLKKMEQIKKKAEAVVNTSDISEREKAAQLRSIYRKCGLGKEKPQVTYLVAKKGVGRKVRRPAGIKGHFKVVDGRMRKDTRSQKRRK